MQHILCARSIPGAATPLRRPSIRVTLSTGSVLCVVNREFSEAPGSAGRTIMRKAKHSAAVKSPDVVDWTGVPTQRVEYGTETTIFAQGDPATSVMYVEEGTVRLSVLSHAGKEAVIAVLQGGRFFGEGCLVGQA